MSRSPVNSTPFPEGASALLLFLLLLALSIVPRCQCQQQQQQQHKLNSLHNNNNNNNNAQDVSLGVMETRDGAEESSYHDNHHSAPRRPLMSAGSSVFGNYVKSGGNVAIGFLPAGTLFPYGNVAFNTAERGVNAPFVIIS